MWLPSDSKVLAVQGQFYKQAVRCDIAKRAQTEGVGLTVCSLKPWFETTLALNSNMSIISVEFDYDRYCFASRHCPPNTIMLNADYYSVARILVDNEPRFNFAWDDTDVAATPQMIETVNLVLSKKPNVRYFISFMSNPRRNGGTKKQVIARVIRAIKHRLIYKAEYTGGMRKNSATGEGSTAMCVLGFCDADFHMPIRHATYRHIPAQGFKDTGLLNKITRLQLSHSVAREFVKV